MGSLCFKLVIHFSKDKLKKFEFQSVSFFYVCTTNARPGLYSSGLPVLTYISFFTVLSSTWMLQGAPVPRESSWPEVVGKRANISMCRFHISLCSSSPPRSSPTGLPLRTQLSVEQVMNNESVKCRLQGFKGSSSSGFHVT